MICLLSRIIRSLKNPRGNFLATLECWKPCDGARGASVDHSREIGQDLALGWQEKTDVPAQANSKYRRPWRDKKKRGSAFSWLHFRDPLLARSGGWLLPCLSRKTTPLPLSFRFALLRTWHPPFFAGSASSFSLQATRTSSGHTKML